MAADQQLVRLWGLLRLLAEKPSGMTAKQISDRMGQSKSTVVRDIDKLAKAGFAILEEPVKNHRLYKLSGSVEALQDVSVTSLEMLSLYAVRSLMAPRVPGAYASGERLFRGGRCHRFDRGWNRAQTHAADSIQTGRQRTSNPRLPAREALFNMGGLYCLGLLADKKVVSTLAVERILDAESTRKTFKVPKGLNLEGRLQGVFGVIEDHDPQAVVVRFRKKVAPYIRARTWRPAQQMKDLPDGGVEWRCTVQGKEEVFAWVLSRGQHAELLKPKAWREELAIRVRELSARYEE